MRKEAIPIHLGEHEAQCPRFERAAGAAVCQTCGITYQRHQIHSWGDPAHILLYLYKTCDGRFWKL